MQSYVIKRVLLFFPTVILLTGVVFVILRLVPGDPALVFLSGVRGDGQEYTQDDLARLRAELGTDRPIYVQYGSWVWNMLRGDFGESFTYKTPVADDLRRTFPITLELTLLASIVANVVAIPLGMISALKRDTLADYATRIITITGIAVPNFWVAILLIFFLVLIFNWIAPIAYVELWEDPLTNLQQMAFPAACLAFSNMAFVARVTRSAMLEVYHEDYIRTARAKGLAEMVVISRHALKNALLPRDYRVRLRVRKAAGRHHHHREYIPDSGHRQAADHCPYPAGLRRNPVRGHPGNLTCARPKHGPGRYVRLAKPTDPLYLISNRHP